MFTFDLCGCYLVIWFQSLAKATPGGVEHYENSALLVFKELGELSGIVNVDNIG